MKLAVYEQPLIIQLLLENNRNADHNISDIFWIFTLFNWTFLYKLSYIVSYRNRKGNYMLSFIHAQLEIIDQMYTHIWSNIDFRYSNFSFCIYIASCQIFCKFCEIWLKILHAVSKKYAIKMGIFKRNIWIAYYFYKTA